MKRLESLLLSVGIVVTVIMVGLTVQAIHDHGVNRPAVPSCPSEDSCVIDYRDGGWYIGERVADCAQEDSCTIDYRDGAWFIDGAQVTR